MGFGRWRKARNKVTDAPTPTRPQSPNEASDVLEKINEIISDTLELGHENKFGSLRNATDATAPNPSESVHLLAEEYKSLYEDCRALTRRMEHLEFECTKTKRLLEDTRERHASELASERSNSIHQLDQAQARYDTSLSKLKKENGNSLKEWQSKLSEVENEFTMRMSSLRKDVYDSLPRWESEELEQSEQFEETKSQFTRMQQQKEEILKNDKQAIGKILIGRDKFTPLSDDDVKKAFSQLVAEVEDWAQVRWQFNNSPWTDELQRQITDTPRELEKHILLDSIWTVLYDYIFFSPFRVLGKEGVVLERQWNDVFGKGNTQALDMQMWKWLC